MRLHLSLFSIFSLFTLQSTVAETPGVCSVTSVKERQRFIIAPDGKWHSQKYNVTEEKKVCCSGYRTETLEPLLCAAVCDPPCENSDCMGPDVCVCHPGHVMINNSSSSCIDVCDACVNGNCINNERECSCYLGYKQDLEFPHICNPICFPECVNATCSAPSLCECYHGYKPHLNMTLDHICVPNCSRECVFGTCTDPNECTCFDGYINDEDSTNICSPVCNRTCENGDCSAPDTCTCHDGFELNPSNHYQCVPQTFPNICGQAIPQAVKYDKDTDCFLIQENISLPVSSHCDHLGGRTSCSDQKHCYLKECLRTFKCFAKTFNNSNEIHCNYGDHFEPHSASINRVANTTKWSDAVLKLHTFQQFNSSLQIKQNVIYKWTLHLSNGGPFCGGTPFLMELRECQEPLLMANINTSFQFWMNVFLICGVLLLVGVGTGAFLWARHRKLNDPLNYREDMIRGYDNESYENCVTEWVSEDSL